jgi:hypothetical protein
MLAQSKAGCRGEAVVRADQRAIRQLNVLDLPLEEHVPTASRGAT